MFGNNRRSDYPLLPAAQSWAVGSVGSQTLQRRGLEALFSHLLYHGRIDAVRQELSAEA